MTKLLEQALEAVRALPDAQQDEIASALIALAREFEDDQDEEDVDPDHLTGLLEGLADADAGRFATEEEIEAIFRRFEK